MAALNAAAPDAPVPLRLRRWHDGDSVDALTALLHRAYAPLGRSGLNFTAVDQSPETTRARLANTQCWVLESASAAPGSGTYIGTVNVRAPCNVNVDLWSRSAPWYLRRDIAQLSQFAVDPSWQARGCGKQLLDAAIQWAHGAGYRGIALDTAQPAMHLRAYYAKRGFTEVGHAQWQGKTYRSALMLRTLSDPAPTADDAEHRTATVLAFWACISARDWPAARAALHDHATMHWLASGEHFDDADAIVRVQAVYPEGWQLRVLNAAARDDGSVHTHVEVIHPPQRYYASSVFHFDGAQIARIDEIWATAENPPDWRTPGVLGAYRRDPPLNL